MESVASFVRKFYHLGIFDEFSTQCGNTLGGRFVRGNKIALYAFRPVTVSTKDGPTEYANKYNVNIHILQTDFIFEDCTIRSLIAESNTIFITLQSLKCKGTKTDYTKISRTYRSVIRACLEKLQDANDHVKAKKVRNQFKIGTHKYQHLISILYSIECIWHLSEILFLDSTPSNVVVTQLLEWVRFHFPAPERMATDLLLLGHDAGNSDVYWPAVKGLIMQGQLEVARALLQLHQRAESSAFIMAGQILKSMPMYSFAGGYSLQKFRSIWQYWLADTERKLSANVLVTEPHLEEIIKLISGDSKVWDMQMQSSEYWYEYFPGFLYYTNPACKHFELGNAANAWLDRWVSLRKDYLDYKPNLKQLDKVILNLMENDLPQVIHSIQLMADNQWFVTHLVDLLYNCDRLQIMGEQACNISKMRKSLLYEYGSMLMTRNSLWQLGMDYLEQCGEEGLSSLEILLTKIPSDTETQAFKVLHICERYNFKNAQREICIIQARRSLRNKRFGNALEWCIRSKSDIFVASVADIFLKHYIKYGNILCPDVLANVGVKMFISPRLVFLVKYFDFYQFYKKSNFLPAAELLVSLLESKITPEYFWPSLLIDCIPLLESQDPKIYSKETCIILHHLETNLIRFIVRKQQQSPNSLGESVNILRDYRIDNIDKMVTLLRLACCRNLSRAIIIENTRVS